MSELADQHQVLNFFIRLWREGNACGHGHWRGRVENVASQEVAYVEDLAALVRFMERWTAEPGSVQNSGHKGD